MQKFFFTWFPAAPRTSPRNPWAGLFFTLGLIAMQAFGSPGFAQEANSAGIASETHLNLPAGAKTKTFEFVFFLPEGELARGSGWVAREIRIDGALTIVEECLSRNLYYAIVRLAAQPDRVATGAIAVWLRPGPTNTPIPPLLSAPTTLQIWGNPFQPDFRCRSEGHTTAFRIHDLREGGASWSGAFTNGGRGRLDQGRLLLHHRYLLEARQSNSNARYSDAAWLRFQVVNALVVCPTCKGSGKWPPPPSSGDTRKPCPKCRGTGQVGIPSLAIIPAQSDAVISGVAPSEDCPSGQRHAENQPPGRK